MDTHIKDIISMANLEGLVSIHRLMKIYHGLAMPHPTSC